MSDQPDKVQDDQKKGVQWTPENINTVFQGLLGLAEKYLLFRDNNAKHEADIIKATSKHDRRIIFSLLAFLGSVIMVMAWLTWSGKVSGDALLFAVGLTIGYIFALIQRFLFGSPRTVESNPES
ncbi:MAG: hypothetical protein KGI08_10985 [Thaumarchaeota archaeon]|nr:hypothetical protein [Nitrososphaerota archaeon]